MHTYSIYGLSVASEIELPGISSDVERTTAEIRVREGAIDLPEEPETADDHCVRATPAEATYVVDGVGAVRVREGQEITVDPDPGATTAHLQFVTLGTALGMLLHQRGCLVLHASAVALGDRVVAFLGATGAGKSTLAAALHARGHDVVADDVVAVPTPADPVVPPGAPLLKFDEETVDELRDVQPRAADSETASTSSTAFRPVTESALSKRFYRVERTLPAARPLTRVYVLDRGGAPGVASLSPRERVLALVRHSYARRRLRATETVARNLRQCVSLAESVSVRRLTVSPSFAEVIERIESEGTSSDEHADTRLGVAEGTESSTPP